MIPFVSVSALILKVVWFLTFSADWETIVSQLISSQRLLDGYCFCRVSEIWWDRGFVFGHLFLFCLSRHSLRFNKQELHSARTLIGKDQQLLNLLVAHRLRSAFASQHLWMSSVQRLASESYISWSERSCLELLLRAVFWFFSSPMPQITRIKAIIKAQEQFRVWHSLKLSPITTLLDALDVHVSDTHIKLQKTSRHQPNPMMFFGFTLNNSSALIRVAYCSSTKRLSILSLLDAKFDETVNYVDSFAFDSYF